MSTTRLAADDFGSFFRAVQGQDKGPFPWQERLARLVFEGGWPEKALDVPTGAGKTACIDIALFHLALEAPKGMKRRAPVRIVFVVDRRLVVDEAHRRAVDIAKALERAEGGVLSRVRERLRLLAEPDRPVLAVSRLRGGAPKEPDWIRTPSQPAVIVSTVDQAGSRLFFRGYGVSDSMKPVHAGLLGSDALYLLDEAHLSQPFVQSVRDSRTFQSEKPWSEDAAPAPFAVVTLSATQSEEGLTLLKSDDRKHPLLGPRLLARKDVQLVSTGDSPTSSAWTEDCAARAWALSSLGGGTAATVAVVVNRVSRARAVYDVLKGRVGEPPGDYVALLIGPSRPIDRDERVLELWPRISARRDEVEEVKPLFVVATQCIEAGADLDFDALVTEVAPLDCLRQRFGRLNRTGRPIDAKGVVIASSTQVGGRAEPDAIYGESLGPTWALLTEKAESRGKGRDKGDWIDFGVEGSRAWLPEKALLGPCLAPRADAPVMMPAFVEQWANTSPVPAADPDVALFLHGPDAGAADVQVIWRADLVEGAEEAWRDRAAVCPPSTLEAVAVPLYAVRAWLLSERPADVADVEFGTVTEERVRPRIGRRALRWRGDDDKTKAVWPKDIRPGDVLVVPSAYGGLDEWGWSPRSLAPVKDLGQEANLRHRGLDILRLTPQMAEQAWRQVDLDEADAAARGVRLRSLLETLRDEEDREVQEKLATDGRVPPPWRDWLQGKRPRLERCERPDALAGTPLAFVRRASRGDADPGGERLATGEATTEDDSSSRAFREVLLAAHSGGVRDYARTFAEQVGLPLTLVEDIALAGWFHDVGKAHQDFKRWLYDGDELAAMAGPDLAKSKRALGPRARERAGLPKGARHEVASLSFAQGHPALAEAHDPELVLWLVGTHHGHGRPFFPAVEWPAPGSSFSTDLGTGAVTSRGAPRLAELTARWCDIQARLTKRFGPWGLARLESILRLADHRRSEAEKEAE